MPFTFAHPVIVLPFRKLSKKYFSMTGLIIGSIMPDFEYFIRMKIQSDYSHTISGLFYFDLPLGIMCAFVFHNVMKISLLNNLPKFLQQRFQSYSSLNWNNYFKRNWLIVAISILIGAVSHLFWDSFTHASGCFVEKWPFLQGSFEILDKQILILKILQHGSTFFGILFIFYFIYKMPIINKIHKINMNYWLIFNIFILIITAIKMCLGLNIKQYGNFVVTIISSIIISFIITPLIMKGNKKCK